MKKKFILRCLMGAPIGLTISMISTIFISSIIGDGTYYAVTPELITDFGSELNAVIVQSLLSCLYGAAFAGASVIWENDRWSLLRQTISHLIICSLATFPVGYINRWMSHDAKGILLYFGIFFVIYAVIWISQYLIIKKRISQMNAKIKSM